MTELWVLDVTAVPHAAEPTLSFAMRVRDAAERPVYTIALIAQIHIEAAQRPHDDATRARLADVFGAPERWGDTARGVLWARREALVPSFTGSGEFSLEVPCSTDLERATTRYLEAVPSGEVPLSFHFNGSILYAGPDDRLQIEQVPWHAEAQFRLPIETWRAAVGDRGGLARLRADTFEELRAYREAHALPSLDAAVADLLDGARAEAAG